MSDDQGWTTVKKRGGRRGRNARGGVRGIAVDGVSNGNDDKDDEPINKDAVKRWILSAQGDMRGSEFASAVIDLVRIALSLSIRQNEELTDEPYLPWGTTSRYERSKRKQLFSRLSKMDSEECDLVCYGLGSLASSGVSRHQLVLLCCLRDSMNDDGHRMAMVDVYDPVLRGEERELLDEMGFNCLVENEACKRVVHRPTVFFMPHCDKVLYDNLLSVNVKAGTQGNVIIIGNSFESYGIRDQSSGRGGGLETSSDETGSTVVDLASDTAEMQLGSDVTYRPRDDAFNDMSVHVFRPAGKDQSTD